MMHSQSHGLFQNSVHSVLYGQSADEDIQKKRRDSCLKNTDPVSKLVGQIENGGFLTPRQAKLKHESISLRNSPKVTDRIRQMLTSKVSPVQSTPSNLNNRNVDIKWANDTKETTGFNCTSADTVIETGYQEDAENNGEIENREDFLVKKDIGSVENDVETTDVEHLNGEQTNVKKTSPGNVENNGITFEFSSKMAQFENETPILRRQAENIVSPSGLISTQDALSKRALCIAEQQNLQDRAVPDFVKAFYPGSHQKNPVSRASTKSEESTNQLLRKTTSGLKILEHMESASSFREMAEEENFSSDSPTSSCPMTSPSQMSSDEENHPVSADFKYSKLARAQLHHQFRRFMKWDSKELTSIATSVARVRYTNIKQMRRTPRNVVIMDLFKNCVKTSNKEQHALCCALFALNDDVTMGVLTSHEEYVAEKRIRSSAY